MRAQRYLQACSLKARTATKAFRAVDRNAEQARASWRIGTTTPRQEHTIFNI